jgi:chromosome segregation ATPase
MADGTDKLVLEHLRHIRGAVDGIREDMRDLKTRVGRLEINVAQIQVALAEHSVRFDRLEARVERIEKRLDLADA